VKQLNKNKNNIKNKKLNGKCLVISLVKFFFYSFINYFFKIRKKKALTSREVMLLNVFILLQKIKNILIMSLTIESRVKKVIAKKLEIDPDKIKLDSRFVEDLSMDSLMRVEIMMMLEEEFKDFKVEIPDEAAEKIKTVTDAISYIESLAT
jgi:acyl carrier protein